MGDKGNFFYIVRRVFSVFIKNENVKHSLGIKFLKKI